MELKAAYKIAVGICYLLQPHCQPERINIAGSVRRKVSEVKDIEIICLPKYDVKEFPPDLFGETPPPVKVLNPQFETLVNNLGEFVKGKPSGKYCQINLPQGVKLDLFMPDPWDYFRQYAIRTGSAQYAGKVIAGGWVRKGWCGSNEGLRKISDCKKKVYKDQTGKEHVSWELLNPDGEKPPVWTSEEDFFNWIGADYIPPQSRFFN